MSHPAEQSGDRGFSFVEAVIVIVLLGTVTAPMLTATRSAVISSSGNRAAAKVETALVNATDRVLRAPKRCNYVQYVQAAVLTEGWRADQATATHAYYVPAATPASPGTWVQGPASHPACPTPSATDGLVQRVTITITSSDGKISRTLHVVKSDV
jgi:Tfp pilus assembly protein PilE